MALTAIVFDMGRTLVDETRQVESPASAFTEDDLYPDALPCIVAYVGDRVDNDVAPALAFGRQAVHIRRGPYGSVHETPSGARRIESLLELVS